MAGKAFLPCNTSSMLACVNLADLTYENGYALPAAAPIQSVLIGNRLYIIHMLTPSVLTVFNIASMTVERYVTLSVNEAHAICSNGVNELYIGTRTSPASVLKISIAADGTLTEAGVKTYTTGNIIERMEYYNGKIYHNVASDKSIRKLNSTTLGCEGGKVLNNLANQPTGLHVASDGYMYFVAGDSLTLHDCMIKFDLTAWNEVSRLDLGADYLEKDWVQVGNKFYLTTNNAPTVMLIIDMLSFTVDKIITFPSGTGAADRVVFDGVNTLYMNNDRQPGQIVAFNVGTEAVQILTFPTGVNRPFDVDITPPIYHKLTVTSSPSGVPFTINDTAFNTPYQQTIIEGSYTIVFPEEIVVSGVTYRFLNWDDGVTNSVRTVALTSDVVLLATYAVETGTLQVSTTPINGEVLVGGVSWGTAPQSRALQTGTYIVGFGAVSGYVKPQDVEVQVFEDTVSSVQGTYTPIASHILAVEALAGTQAVQINIEVNGVNKTTPYSESLQEGLYTVAVPESIIFNTQTYIFKAWNDSSTQTTKTVNLTSNVSLIAYYEAEITPPPTTHILNVKAYAGTQEVQVNFDINGVLKATPYSESLQEGAYNVKMFDQIVFNNVIYHFKQWSDGYTNPLKPVNLVADMLISAMYESQVTPPPTITPETILVGVAVPLILAAAYAGIGSGSKRK